MVLTDQAKNSLPFLLKKLTYTSLMSDMSAHYKRNLGSIRIYEFDVFFDI